MLRRSFCGAAVALALLSHRAQAIDIDGWNGTKWGMSEAQVQRIFSGRLRRPSMPAFAGTDLQRGTYLEIDGFRTGDLEFQLQFDFWKNKLGRVHLIQASDGKSKLILEALESKYGLPMSQAPLESDWVCGRTHIKLVSPNDFVDLTYVDAEWDRDDPEAIKAARDAEIRERADHF
jgi:hypothetical protein